MRVLRVRSGDLEVATASFIKDGRAFRTVGVAHIAEPGFWRGLQRDLDGDPNEVHLEGIRDDRKQMPIETKYQYEDLAEWLSLESQTVGLKKRDGWRVTDMTVSQMLNRSPDPERLESYLDKAFEMDAADLPDALARPFRWLIRNVLRWSRFMPTPSAEIRHVVRDVRTDYAMRLMLQRDASVTTVWGADHLPRMRRILLRDGWRQTGLEYRTAICRVATA